MATVYRIHRNIEKSILDYLQEQIDLSFTAITVLKGNSRVYSSDVPMPIVAVVLTDNIHNPSEIGNTATRRDVLVIINLYCDNMGLTLDLKEYIISKIKNGLVYYKYTIENRVVSSKIADGRIQFKNLRGMPIDLMTDKSTLNERDRNRWQITANCQTNKVEE